MVREKLRREEKKNWQLLAIKPKTPALSYQCSDPVLHTRPPTASEAEALVRVEGRTAVYDTNQH